MNNVFTSKGRDLELVRDICTSGHFFFFLDVN